MTALTLAARPARETALRPVPWRNMLWVTWRQHRATLISVPALFGAVGVFLWIMGLHIRHDYAVLMACHPFTSNACQTLNQNFNMTDWTIGNTINILLNLAPALIGAFAGGSLLAFAVGALAGMFFRRTVPAMAVTLGIYTGLAILTWTVLRKHYPLALVSSNPRFSNGPTNPSQPWILSSWQSGHTTYFSYIPVSRFWPMQFVEGGWLLALSILLFAATVWLVRRRAA